MDASQNAYLSQNIVNTLTGILVFLALMDLFLSKDKKKKVQDRIFNYWAAIEELSVPQVILKSGNYAIDSINSFFTSSNNMFYIFLSVVRFHTWFLLAIAVLLVNLSIEYYRFDEEDLNNSIKSLEYFFIPFDEMSRYLIKANNMLRDKLESLPTSEAINLARSVTLTGYISELNMMLLVIIASIISMSLSIIIIKYLVKNLIKGDMYIRLTSIFIISGVWSLIAFFSIYTLLESGRYYAAALLTQQQQDLKQDYFKFDDNYFSKKPQDFSLMERIYNPLQGYLNEEESKFALEFSLYIFNSAKEQGIFGLIRNNLHSSYESIIQIFNGNFSIGGYRTVLNWAVFLNAFPCFMFFLLCFFLLILKFSEKFIKGPISSILAWLYSYEKGTIAASAAFMAIMLNVIKGWFS